MWGHRLELWLCLVTAAVTLHMIHAVCPHEDPNKNFRRWSDASRWTGQTKPVEGEAVVIDDHVLLDESTPDLQSVTVNTGGSLVFLPGGDYVLTVRYMMLHGALHIGGPGECRFHDNAKIRLLGNEGEYDVPGFGEKFVGVAEGGTLELHGKNKLSWTKLTSTVNKLDYTNGLLYNKLHDNTVDSWNNGIVAYITRSTGEEILKKHIYTVGTSSWRLTHEPPQLINALNSVQDGDHIVLAVQKKAVGSIDMEPIFDAIENATLGEVTGTSAIRQLQDGDAWVLSAVRGEYVHEKRETRMNMDKEVVATIYRQVPDSNMVCMIRSMTNPEKSYKGRVDVQCATMDAGMPVLNLAQEASTWLPGDRLLITSTDYEFRQAEEAEVVYCPPTVCAPNQRRAIFFPQYTHWGEVTDGVDMRAEVALLSHNVVIEGVMQDRCPAGDACLRPYDGFGGQIKIEHRFASVRIDSVELRHMGQLTPDGGYPIHFHMCRDVDDVGGYAHAAYVKGTSIVDGYNRCLVVQGTQGLTIQDNVAFNHIGMCYVLLEGGEIRTVLDGNLAAHTRENNWLDNNLDRDATTFFITNPMVYFRNNVAAGGMRNGIAYLFPEVPVGESADQNFTTADQIRYTPYAQFTNNGVHSYGRRGLHIENSLKPEGNGRHSTNKHTPKADPNNPKESADAPNVIHRLTAFKNRWQHAWIRGGYYVVDHSSFSDSARALTFADYWGAYQEQFIENSIIIGESDNIGEPTWWWNNTGKFSVPYPRALPYSWDPSQPIQGYAIIDGPTYMNSVWFKGFTPNENRTAGAIGWSLKNDWPGSASNRLRDVRFAFNDGETEGARVYQGDSSVPGHGDRDGDRDAMVVDVDGSLTGYPNATVVKNYPVTTTALCYNRPNWGMAVCPHKFGKLRVYAPEARNSVTRPVLTRDDLAPSDGLEMPHKYVASFPVILGDTHSYILHWTDFFPQRVDLEGKGVEKDYSLRVGLCVPRDAELHLQLHRPQWRNGLDRWTEVDTLDLLDLDSVGDRFYWDRENGIIFVKLMNYRTRCADTLEECKDGCPFLRVTLVSGNRSDSDCRGRISSYSRSPVTSAAGLAYNELPASAVEAPVDFGAGSAVPFKTRAVVDGGYGQWSEWGPCTVTCGGGTQIRTRACDSPMPQNGGLPCSGSPEDTQICGTNPCEIHGGFSEWTEWSACSSPHANGIQGKRERTRACDNPTPMYNGEYCTGETSEMESCILTEP